MINPRFAPPVLLAMALAILAGAGCSKQAREQRVLARANRDFEAADYDAAEVEYRTALQLAPLDPAPIRQLGILYFNEGRVLQAFGYLLKSTRSKPQDTEVRLKLGLAFFALRRPNEARAVAQQTLKTQPGNEDALLLLAETTSTPKLAEETRQLVEELRKHNPDCAGYHLVLGSLRMMQRDSAGAELELRKALKLDPKSSAVYLELGNLYWQRRDLGQARQNFKEAAELSPLRSRRRLRRVDFELANQAPEEAKKALGEINLKAPDYIPAWVATMNLAYQEHRYEDCAAAVQTILARDPRNFDAMMARGNLKMAQGDAAGAGAEFKKVDDLYKNVPSVKFQSALAYVRQGDFARAEDFANQALARSPNFAPAVLLLADLNLRQGNAPAAIASLIRLLKQQPALASGYLLLGQAYLMQQDPDRATAVYRGMAALFPKDPRPSYHIGIMLTQQKKTAEARKAFEQSAAIAPDYIPALEMLVNEDLQEKRYAAAADRVDALAGKYPRSAAPWLLRAKIHSAQRNLGGAEADLLKAIDLDPTSQNAYLLLARIYLASKKYEQAIAKLTALADRTHSLTALMEIGLIHSALKQFDAAGAAYQKVLAIDPRFTPALNNLAYLDCETPGKLDEAERLAQAARLIRPEDGTIADTLGWIAFKKGQYHKALALVRESTDKTPGDAEVQYHLGMVHYMLGEEASARLAFKQVLESATDIPEKEEARRRLAILDIDVTRADGTVKAGLENRVRAAPDDPVALVRLAAIDERDGEAGAAAANYEAALKLDPQDPRVMAELAKLYSGPLQDSTKARKLARSAHELAPNDPEISGILGRLFYQAGDYPRSLSLLEEATRGLPNRTDLAFDLARAYYGIGRVTDAQATLQGLLPAGAGFAQREEARRFSAMIAAGASRTRARASLADARRILDSDPNFVPAMMVSALVLQDQGDYAEAGRLYEKILAANSFFTPAARELAVLYTQHLGDDKRAYDYAVKAREAAPDDPELARVLGILHYRRADYAGAVPWLQESLRHRGDDPETLYYLGMAHYQLKDSRSSREELQRALDLKISRPDADEAKRVLDKLRKGAPVSAQSATGSRAVPPDRYPISKTAV